MRLTFKIGLFAFGLTASTFAYPEELGRLFFTPAQRAQLGYTYTRETTSDHNGRALMLNGIVQQHGGKRTAWINGVPQQVGSSDDKTPESLLIPVPGQTKTIKLKVGQRILLNPTDSPKATNPDTPKLSSPKQ
jgi:hypothetical protein